MIRSCCCAFVLLGFLIRAVFGQADPTNPSPRIISATAYRADSDRLAFRIELSGRPDPARLRILLDVDGHGHGEPNSGADYMLEGVNFYRYPEDAKGWQWTPIEPPLMIGRDRQVVYVLPSTFRATSVRWLVQLTDKNWATTDRFPKDNYAELRFENLPTLPAKELAREVATPSLKIMSVVPHRAAGGALAFTATFASPPDPARFRLMIETDQPHAREPNSAADYMLEGVNLYRYAPGAFNWTWNALAPPVIVAEGRTLTYILSDVHHAAAAIKWFAETTNPDWSSADRFPATGMVESVVAELPDIPAEKLVRQVKVPALDIRDVTAFRFGEAGLAFRIALGAKPDIARLRIMFGDDYMVEGATFYKRPAGATGWTWQPIGSPVYLEDMNTLTCILFDAGQVRRASWYVETTTTNWTTADRFPALGRTELNYDRLPPLEIDKHPKPVDLRELTAYSPRSLSVRFDEDFKHCEWKKVERALPVHAMLIDVVSGETAALVPEAAFECGKLTSWKGHTLGVEWILVAGEEDGGLTLTGHLQDGRDRCLRVTVGYELDLRGWIWHDDVRFHREMATGLYGNMTASSFGVTGQQSLYPFAVISSNITAWVVETDLDEPRIVQLVADADQKFFGASYDLALTQQTKKFPGQATFRCTFRKNANGGASAFRYALTDFYRHHPGFAQRRVPRSGLWMPFFDISKLSAAEDFGFAFLEKEGSHGADVDYARQHGILTLVYTEPWLYWLPMPAGTPRNETEALRMMKLLSETGDQKPNEFAAAALTGAARSPAGSVRMKFMDVPWSSGARMEVSTDPDLPGFNRAMAEWRAISNALSDARVDGIYLDSMQAPSVADYNPAAIAAADYPCTFEMVELKPAISSRIAAFEFTSALGGYLRAHGKFLMGNFPCWDFPFYMPFIDIPGEETSWPLSDAKLNYRRAMSGQKPFGFLEATKFDAFGSDKVEQYFRDCMFWGFLPSFFSYDGANDPYWLNSKWYERDRPLFRKYLPLIRRLADAGWQPIGPVQAKDGALWIEHFGDRYITVRNTRSSALTTELLGEGVLINPLTAECQKLPCRIALPAGAVETFDVVPASGMEEEIAFLRSWKSPTGQAEACLRNLQSLDVKLSYPLPAVRGEPNRLLIGSPNGTVTQMFTEADLDTNGWLTVKTDASTRSFHPTFVAPVEVVAGDARVVARRPTATIDMSVVNHSSRERKVELKWEGDFGAGQTNTMVGIGGLRALPVQLTTTNQLDHGHVTVVARADGAELWRKEYFVSFVGEDSSLARDSRVTLTVDSTYMGYGTKALTDGVIETTGLPWNEAAWASDETGDAHWVKIGFPAPTKVREMTIHWNVEEGVTYASRRGEVYGWMANDERVLLGKFENDAPKPVTKVAFEPIELKAIQLYQPPQSGAKDRPNLLWLAEVEVR